MQPFSREYLREIFTKPTNYINTNRGKEYYDRLYAKMEKRLSELKNRGLLERLRSDLKSF